MLIHELSAKTGASVRSIRHYEAKGLIGSARLPNGYRNYESGAVLTVKTIQLYLGLGLTTEAIGKIIACPVSPQNNAPICQEAYRLYSEKREQVKTQIQLLQQIQSQLEGKIKEFELASRRNSIDETEKSP